MNGERLRTFAVLHQPRRAVAARAPQAAALPAGFRIVDAPVEAFSVKSQRVGHGQKNHLAVFQSDQAVVQIGGGHRHIVAEAERVVLIDPRVVARLRTVIADSLEARAGIFIEGPALGAMIAGGFRAVERALAFSPVEAGKMAACERRPNNALFVDVSAADAEPRQWYVVNFRDGGLGGIWPGRDAHDGAWKSSHGAPDRAVSRARHDCIEARRDALVLRRIHRLVRLDVSVAL